MQGCACEHISACRERLSGIQRTTRAQLQVARQPAALASSEQRPAAHTLAHLAGEARLHRVVSAALPQSHSPAQGANQHALLSDAGVAAQEALPRSRAGGHPGEEKESRPLKALRTALSSRCAWSASRPPPLRPATQGIL